MRHCVTLIGALPVFLLVSGLAERFPAVYASGFEVYFVAAVGASVATFCAGVRPGRRAWLLVGLACMIWCAVSLFYSLAGQPGGLSVSDFLWLAFYPPVFAGVLALSRREAAAADVRLWLDGLVAALCVTSTVLVVALPVTLRSHLPIGRVVFLLVPPLLDLLLLGFVVATVTAARGHATRRWLMLAAAIAIYTLADTVFMAQNALDSYRAGSPVECWVADRATTDRRGGLDA